MFMGSKDTVSWESFLTSLDGRPEWIVVDGDSGVMSALKNLKWAEQGTVIFRCEAHLLMNAEDAARADGLIPWERTQEGDKRAADELAEMRRLLTPRKGRAAQWELAELFTLMREALKSERQWKAFKRAVRLHVPANKTALRRWIRDNEALVIDQLQYKADHPFAPLSIGAVETSIRTIKRHLTNRLRQFGNERRFNLTLALMVLEMRGAADRRLYHRLLHQHFLTQARRWQIADRKALLFDKGESSIDRRIVEARVNQAKYAILVNQAATDAKDLSRQRALKSAAGLRPRSRRDQEDSLDLPTSFKGLTLADIPDVLAQYAPALNGGTEASAVAALSRRVITWRCKRGHIWQRAPRERLPQGSRCPYCHGHKTAPEDSLQAKFPAVAAEWHPTLNAPLDPAEVRPQSGKKVWWQCPDGHDPYQQLVGRRTMQRMGCPHPDHKRAPVGKPGRRSTTAAAQRRARRLVRAGDQLLDGDLDASGEWVRALDEAAINAARTRLAELTSRMSPRQVAGLLNRAERTIMQAKTFQGISIPASRRIEHLAAIVDALGKHTDAARWFDAWHPGLRSRPADLLLGEWLPEEPLPASVLAAARDPRPNES
jgi:hypothetical protein